MTFIWVPILFTIIMSWALYKSWPMSDGPDDYGIVMAVSIMLIFIFMIPVVILWLIWGLVALLTM
jgi:hypothetical protein